MKKVNSNKLIARFYSAIGKEWISNLSFPITSLCLRTDRIENTENKSFSVPWKSSISKSSNSSELETFKSKRFEGFANIENQENFLSLEHRKFLRK